MNSYVTIGTAQDGIFLGTSGYYFFIWFSRNNNLCWWSWPCLQSWPWQSTNQIANAYVPMFLCTYLEYLLISLAFLCYGIKTRIMKTCRSSLKLGDELCCRSDLDSQQIKLPAVVNFALQLSTQLSFLGNAEVLQCIFYCCPLKKHILCGSLKIYFLILYLEKL